MSPVGSPRTHIARHKVEVGGIKFVCFGKVGHTHAKVAELVYGGRSCVEH